jgi:two-component system, NarL family, sensor histidine kinase UhpB
VKPEAATPLATPPAAPWADFPTGEVVITTTYLVLASLWIVFSDLWLDWITGDPEESLRLQTYKGLNFVLTTSVLLYVVLRRSFTRRRRAEEQSRAVSERFELVAHAASDAIFDWDLGTNAIWWNEGFSRLFGFAPDADSTIDSLKDRIHPDDREAVLTGIRRIADSGGSAWSGEYRFRRKDGTYAYVMDRGFLIRGTDGQPIRLVGGLSDVTERRRADEQLRQSQRQLRALSARLQSLREEERTHLARELHDELGQLLTGLRMELQWIERKLSPAEPGPGANALVERVVSATDLTDQTIAAVQKIAAELRPGVLDSLGLLAALKHEAERFQHMSGVRCTVRLPERQPPLSAPATTAVFRIFQEALTNVARHAAATGVEADLQEAGTDLVLQIRDNGNGIAAEAVADPASLGLLGMRERAAFLGGEVTLAPAGPRGTCVTLRVPLAAEAPGRQT